MKLIEIVGKPKATSEEDLINSIKNGKFTKDGRHLIETHNRFSCAAKNLTSLEGCPKEIGGKFFCHNNKLTSLVGGPQKVGSSFTCSENYLTSLEGCPKEVGTDFFCNDNKLTSLKGCPQVINGDFFCYINSLTSLEGCAQVINGSFFGFDNRLTSLEGCPQIVEANFSCSKNKLTSLKDIHKRIKKMEGTFFLTENPIKSHVLGLLKIPGCLGIELDNREVAKIISKYLPLGDLLDCQEELIEAGFEEYAQL